MSSPNTSGKMSESLLKCALDTLKEKGYTVTSQHVFQPHELRRPHVYSSALRADQFIRGHPASPEGLVFSCKRQNKSGSAREKLHAHVQHTLKECMPYPSILVMVGKEWTGKEKAFVLGEKNRWLVDVLFDYNEVLIWADKAPSINEKKSAQANEYQWANLPLFPGF